MERVGRTNHPFWQSPQIMPQTPFRRIITVNNNIIGLIFLLLYRLKLICAGYVYIHAYMMTLKMLLNGNSNCTQYTVLIKIIPMPSGLMKVLSRYMFESYEPINLTVSPFPSSLCQCHSLQSQSTLFVSLIQTWNLIYMT